MGLTLSQWAIAIGVGIFGHLAIYIIANIIFYFEDKECDKILSTEKHPQS